MASIKLDPAQLFVHEDTENGYIEVWWGQEGLGPVPPKGRVLCRRYYDKNADIGDLCNRAVILEQIIGFKMGFNEALHGARVTFS